jgi:hypothetical protein
VPGLSDFRAETSSESVSLAARGRRWHASLRVLARPQPEAPGLRGVAVMLAAALGALRGAASECRWPGVGDRTRRTVPSPTVESAEGRGMVTVRHN